MISVTGPGQPPLPARPPVQNISIWVEKFSVMAAFLTSRFPEKVPELFAYQASIMRAECNFDGRRWVAYDRCFRREALAQKNLDWSVPNARLYNEAFTGNARSLPRCSFFLQEDHQSQSCPRNPHRPWFGWFPEPSGAPPSAPGPSSKYQECCHRYNEGRCKQTTSLCRYLHRCLECAGPHPRVHCPRLSQSGRPRSPLGHQQRLATKPRHRAPLLTARLQCGRLRLILVNPPDINIVITMSLSLTVTNPVCWANAHIMNLC